jgi:CheY-like chemotaxis protein
MVIGDSTELRGLLRAVLEASGRFELVAEASDGQSAITLIGRRQPYVVVIDIGLPDLMAFDLIPRLRGLSPDTRIVVFTGTSVATDSEMAPLPTGARSVMKGALDRLIAALEPAPSVHTVDIAAKMFPRHPASASQARRFITDACTRCGCPERADDARLIVSELATNALLHAGSQFEIRVRRSERRLRIEVGDAAPDALPNPQTPSDLSECGRGLTLVSSLSALWGIEPTDSAKIVWAELEIFPGAKDYGPAWEANEAWDDLDAAPVSQFSSGLDEELFDGSDWQHQL